MVWTSCQSAVMSLSLWTTLTDPDKILLVLAGTGGWADTGLDASIDFLNAIDVHTQTQHGHRQDRHMRFVAINEGQHKMMGLLTVICDGPVLPVGGSVSGGLQINWGSECRVGHVPWITTNRNVTLVLQRKDWKDWNEMLSCYDCLKVGHLRSLTGCRPGSGLACALKKKKKFILKRQTESEMKWKCVFYRGYFRYMLEDYGQSWMCKYLGFVYLICGGLAGETATGKAKKKKSIFIFVPVKLECQQFTCDYIPGFS